MARTNLRTTTTSTERSPVPNSRLRCRQPATKGTANIHYSQHLHYSVVSKVCLRSTDGLLVHQRSTRLTPPNSLLRQFHTFATMASTHRHTSAYTYAARTLILLTMSTTAFGQTFKACYSSSDPLKNQGAFKFQSEGHCQGLCTNATQAVFALTAGNECYCGAELPNASTKVENSKCNEPCPGYPDNICTSSCLNCRSCTKR